MLRNDDKSKRLPTTSTVAIAHMELSRAILREGAIGISVFAAKQNYIVN